MLVVVEFDDKRIEFFDNFIQRRRDPRPVNDLLNNRPRGMFGPSVFIDNRCDPAERYKLTYFAR